MSFLNHLFGIDRPESLRTALHSKKVRVVVNALHAKSGGGITYLRNILPLLSKDERFELHIFLHRSQLALFHPLDERIVVHAFDFPLTLARLMTWEQLVLPVMTNIISADVVFAPANFGSILIRHQVVLLRNALSVAKTETRLSKLVYWFALGVITFASLLRTKRAIAVSQFAADSLSLGMTKLFGNKIKVIHHGISTQFHPDETVKREDFILAVSDIYVQKNLHTMFQALQPIFTQKPHLKIMIAGEKIDEWYYERVAALSRELGIDDRVHFLGRLNREQLLDLYRRCRLFVFPSTAETFGNPLVEAMACGAPIVCSNSSAIPEIVGDAALMCDPLHAEDMSAAILKLLDSPQLQTELSRRGIARAACYSWEDTAKFTAEVLLEASQKR